MVCEPIFSCGQSEGVQLVIYRWYLVKVMTCHCVVKLASFFFFQFCFLQFCFLRGELEREEDVDSGGHSVFAVLERVLGESFPYWSMPNPALVTQFHSLLDPGDLFLYNHCIYCFGSIDWSSQCLKRGAMGTSGLL